MAVLYYKFVPTQTKSGKSWFWKLLLFFALSYSIFTIIARLLFDQFIPLFEPRIQYPLFAGIFLIVIYGLYQLQEFVRRTGWIFPAMLAGVYAVCIFFVVWNYSITAIGDPKGILTSTHEKGLGLERMNNNPLLPVLARYPLQENRFFTDNIEILYYLSTLNSYQLLSGKSEQIARVTSEMDDHGVVLVFFDKDALGPVFRANIPLLELIYQGDAEVYVYPVR